MWLRICLVGLLSICAVGCFPQKAPHRPVTAVSIEKALAEPATVEFLDMHDKPQEILPADLSAFTSLTKLSLRNTGITEAPAGLKTLPALDWLDLGENQFTAFPDPILIPNVKLLYLSDNAIAELPASIASLSKLSYLNLDRNQLTNLTAEIGNLPELVFLRLNGNKLTALPESLGNLKKLKRLYLKGNPIPDPEKERIKALLPETDVIY